MRAALVVSALLLAAFTARAESVSVIGEGAGGADAHLRKAQRAAEAALRELSGLSVQEASGRAGPRRSCNADVRCLVSQAGSAGTTYVLFLNLRQVGSRVNIDAVLVDTTLTRPARRSAEATSADLEAVVRGLTETLTPAAARKGWGGLGLSGPPGAQVRVDGRKVGTTPLETVPLTSGVHSVDVHFAGGQAVLHRVHVPEGERPQLDVQPQAAAGEGPERAKSVGALRWTSYGLWAAGTVAVAGSLLAGAASRQAGSQLRPCQADRACLFFDEASRQHQLASSYAQTGNLLLGAGAALAATGAGLFTFDLITR